MKNRKILLHDGTTAHINDNEWTSYVNIKNFDETKTEIIRLNRHINATLMLLQVSKSNNTTEVYSEHWEAILMGADPRPVVIRAAGSCGVSEETLQQALSAL